MYVSGKQSQYSYHPMRCGGGGGKGGAGVGVLPLEIHERVGKSVVVFWERFRDLLIFKRQCIYNS